MNLLFVTTDHQRHDSLGLVQAGREVTPTANALAARGCRFERAYTACPLCVPARTSLATGLHPHRHGVLHNDWRGETARAVVPLHERLARAGYAVAHVGMQHIQVRPGLRERVPFVHYCDQHDYFAWRATAGGAGTAGLAAALSREVEEALNGGRVRQRYSSAAVAPWPAPLAHHRDRWFAARAVETIRALAARPAQPFAVFCNFWAPHPPLEVPAEYAALFAPQDIDLPPGIGVPAAGQPPGRRRGVAAQLAQGLSADDWRRTRAAHFALTRLADDAMGELLAALGPCQADTLVVFCSDHGDHLGEHGMYQKMELYDTAARVPLVCAGPGVVPGVCRTPVSLVDVAPTVLEWLGLEPMAPGDGQSLASVLRTGNEPPERPVFLQYRGNPGPGDTRFGVVWQGWKLVLTPDDVAELYDLAADPHERHNRADDPGAAARRGELEALLHPWAAIAAA